MSTSEITSNQQLPLRPTQQNILSQIQQTQIPRSELTGIHNKSKSYQITLLPNCTQTVVNDNQLRSQIPISKPTGIENDRQQLNNNFHQKGM